MCDNTDCPCNPDADKGIRVTHLEEFIEISNDEDSNFRCKLCGDICSFDEYHIHTVEVFSKENKKTVINIIIN